MANSQLLTMANKWLNRLAPLLLMLIVVWLCWNVARIMWLFLAPPIAPSLPELPIQMSQNTQKNQTSAQSFTIFEAASNTPKKPVINTQAPSNILLKGVMTAIPLSKSSALISINGQIQNYRVGKQLEGTNYTLDSVDWNEISLKDSQNGITTIKMNDALELNQNFNAKDKKSNSRANNNRRTSSSTRTNNNITKRNTQNPEASTNKDSNHQNNTQNSAKSTAQNNDTNQKSSNKANNTANSANKTIQDIKKDSSKYLNQMGVKASNDGYQITNAMPAKVRQKMGLKVGDKIIEVNGQKVGRNQIADAQLLAQVQQDGQANIKIKRGESVFTFNSKF